MPKISADPKTLKEKYQLAFAKFNDALLMPDTFEYPKTVEEQIACAAQVRQVLETYFKPNWMQPDLVKGNFNLPQNIYDYLKIANNPYANYVLKTYRMEYHTNLAEKLNDGLDDFLKKESETCQTNAKAAHEMEKIKSLAKETYEKIYSCNDRFNAIFIKYYKSIASPTKDTASKVTKHFQKIKNCSVAYNQAFLKNFCAMLEKVKKPKDYRKLLILILHYYAFLKERNKRLNSLLLKLPNVIKIQVEVILHENDPHHITERLKNILKRVEPDFTTRAERFFIFQKMALTILPDELEERCPEQLKRINAQYKDFLYQLLDTEFEKLDTYFVQTHQFPFIKEKLKPAVIRQLSMLIENDDNEVEKYSADIFGFIILYEIEREILGRIRYYKLAFAQSFQLADELNLKPEQRRITLEEISHETMGSIEQFEDLRRQEKRYQKAQEAKRREERARQEADELKKKDFLLQQEALKVKNLDEILKVKAVVTAGLTKLSAEENSILCKIIQYPRAHHHKLDSKTFCALVRKLPLFQLDPTSDGYLLLFNNKPIDGFHRQHDKLMDGNFLQKFANVFNDLKIELPVLPGRQTIATASNRK